MKKNMTIGIAWFNENDWAEWKKISADLKKRGDPGTWKIWPGSLSVFRAGI